MGHKKTEARDESTFKSLMSLSNLIKIVGGTESAHPNTGRSFATNRAKSGSYLSGLLYYKSLFVVFTAMHLHFIQKAPEIKRFPTQFVAHSIVSRKVF